MKNINKGWKIKLLLTVAITIVIGGVLFFWYGNNSDKLKILYHTENEFGPVWIYEENNARCMTFSKPPTKVVQSCMSLTKPDFLLFAYTQTFMSSLFFKEYPRKVLLIGLGGATLGRAINKLAPHAELDIVDINPAIIPINEEYFNFKEGGRNKIFIEDGFDFAKSAPENSYDIVLLDAYDDEYIAPQLLTNEFFKNIKRIMTKSGIVAVNTLQNSKFTDLENKLVKDNFGEYYSLPLDGSRTMIASKSVLPNFEEIYARSQPWIFRFGAVGVSSHAIASLYKDKKDKN